MVFIIYYCFEILQDGILDRLFFFNQSLVLPPPPPTLVLLLPPPPPQRKRILVLLNCHYLFYKQRKCETPFPNVMCELAERKCQTNTTGLETEITVQVLNKYVVTVLIVMETYKNIE
jgi:hypothetical protein